MTSRTSSLVFALYARVTPPKPVAISGGLFSSISLASNSIGYNSSFVPKR